MVAHARHPLQLRPVVLFSDSRPGGPGSRLASAFSGTTADTAALELKNDPSKGYPVRLWTWGPFAGLEVRTAWHEENRELAREINAALDRTVLWMQRNSHEFARGGKYEAFAEEAGFLASDEENALAREAIRDGWHYVTSGLYTDAWIDATWQFIEAGVGILFDELPAKEQVFISPSEL